MTAHTKDTLIYAAAFAPLWIRMTIFLCQAKPDMGLLGFQVRNRRRRSDRIERELQEIIRQ